MCGLPHSTLVTAPVSVTGLLTSNSAAKEWWEKAGRATATASPTAIITRVACMWCLTFQGRPSLPAPSCTPKPAPTQQECYPHRLLMPLSITWFGHATFLLTSPGGRRILFDPWIAGNPSAPESAKNITEVDVVLLSHGHGDHTGDAVSIARATGAPTVAPFELAEWLTKKGLQKVTGMNP